MQIPIFIISLKKDVARRSIITEKLNKLNLEYTIVDALEGKNISDIFFNTIPTPNKKPSGKNELACALSHQNIYKLIIEKNIDWALILEDDAIINDNLAEVINTIQPQKLKKSSAYLFGGQEGLSSRKKLSLSLFNFIKIGPIKFRRVTSSPKKLFRACCYMISQETCRKLIHEFNKGFFVADEWGLLHERKIIQNFF